MQIYHLANLMHMIPQINNSIDSLDVNFRKKFNAWWAEVTAKYPHARVFEARRSQERQQYLYAQWRTRPWRIVTWTLDSNHKDWKAVDIVFLNNWKLERAWPYNDLIAMAKKYWIRNLAPKELCHFQCNWVPYEDYTKQEVDPLIQKLIDNGIWNWVEWEGVTTRVALLIAKAIYNWK